MPYERCESKVANILAGLDNLPDHGDAQSKIITLAYAVSVLDVQVQKLQKKLDELISLAQVVKA